MREIAGPGNVSGQFVDYDPVNNPLGTVYTADYGNDVQNDLIAIQDFAGLPEASGASKNVLKSIIKITKMYSREIGEPFFNPKLLSPVEFDDTSETTASNFFPAICLDTIDIQTTISTTNWPLLVPYLRGIQLKYREGRSDEVASFPCSVAGSVVTLTNTTANNRLLISLAKWVLVHGSYTNWITITVDGVEYAITNINTSTRAITVTGSPASVSTCTFFPHRVTGSTTTARLYEVSGKSIIAANDAAGLFINMGLMLGYFQGHAREFLNGGSSNGQQLSATAYGINSSNTVDGSRPRYYKNDATPDALSRIVTDDVNGTPRTSSETHSPSLVNHLYMFGREYIA